MDSVYDLYLRGCELLEHGDHQAAIVPLTRARELDPRKTSIREALGRALFHAQSYERAAAEFQALAAIAPTNDYALFCLGRSMQLLDAALARGLPPLPRSRPPRRGDVVVAEPRRDLLSGDSRVPMLCSNDSFRAVVGTVAGSTGSGRTPAFFTPHAWGESHSR